MFSLVVRPRRERRRSGQSVDEQVDQHQQQRTAGAGVLVGGACGPADFGDRAPAGSAAPPADDDDPVVKRLESATKSRRRNGNGNNSSTSTSNASISNKKKKKKQEKKIEEMGIEEGVWGIASPVIQWRRLGPDACQLARLRCYAEMDTYSR